MSKNFLVSMSFLGTRLSSRNVVTLAAGVLSTAVACTSAEKLSPALSGQDLGIESVIGTRPQSGSVVGTKPELRPTSFDGPLQLRLGQAFTLRVESHLKPGGSQGSAIVYVVNAPDALIVDAKPRPSAASATGRWTLEIHGRIATDAVLAGTAYKVQVALIDADGNIGEVVTWQPFILEGTAPSCPGEAACGAAECGRDPVCGVQCGLGCNAGEACSSAGVCEEEFAGCDEEKMCRDRECGIDPVCGVECGQCGTGLSCVDGSCVDAGTETDGTSTNNSDKSNSGTDDSTGTSTDGTNSGEEGQCALPGDPCCAGDVCENGLRCVNGEQCSCWVGSSGFGYLARRVDGAVLGFMGSGSDVREVELPYSDGWPVRSAALDGEWLQLGVSGVGGPFLEGCIIEAPDGTANCSGRNNYGQLGTGVIGDDTRTQLVKGQFVVNEAGNPVSGMQSIVGASKTNCGVLTSGEVVCWGSNATVYLVIGYRTNFSF